jgi:hypothetical protein
MPNCSVLVTKIVRNGTDEFPSQYHPVYMLNNRLSKERSKATLASVTKEMANPRMARSAMIAELDLDTTRIREQPSATVPGRVNKIIPSEHSDQPEKAQIGIHDSGRKYSDIRIENLLTDEHGDEVRLKKGAPVDVTITAKSNRKL